MKFLKCGFLGPAGTFSEEAGLSYFPEEAELVPLDSINQIFAGIREGRLDNGIVPVENSLEGPVNITMDLLFADKNITITGEKVLSIRHFLLVPPGVGREGIKRLYSHPQAVAQTNGFINKYLPGAEINYTESTARAAEVIKNSRDSGMIGSRRISELYGLEILAGDIQCHEANLTRFLVIGRAHSLAAAGSATGSRREIKAGGRTAAETGDRGDPACRLRPGYKTSIICAPEVNRAGVLYQILGCFARAGINLTRVESRPTKRQLGEYLFYIDFIGHYQDRPVREALEGVCRQTGVFRLIGSYLRADRLEQKLRVRKNREEVEGVARPGAGKQGVVEEETVKGKENINVKGSA